jgi:site-specific DNA recombinase
LRALTTPEHVDAVRAVAYARVSSATQRDRDTIASQMRVLPAFVERMGWTLVRPIDTYVDDGRTAKAGHLEARLGLAALLRDAALGIFDVVVVVDLDRLTRSEDLAERGAILGAFQRAGVRVASASSGQVLDLSTSIGDLFGTLQAFFAAEENRKRRERTVQGKLTAIQRARKPSGPTPYGLHYDKATGVWSVDPVKGPIVVEMFERVAAGESCMAICDDLEARGIPRPRGHWERHRVWDIVRSRFPVGEWTVDKARKLVISVPPIVTEEMWQRAQHALIAHGKRGLRRTKHIYLLEGLAKCAKCGSDILIRSANPGRKGRINPAAYVCRLRKHAFRGMGRCDAPIIRVADADASVWEQLERLVMEPGLIDAMLEARREHADDPTDWKADAAGYRTRIERLDRAESALLVRFSKGKVSERALDIELDRLGKEREALRMQLRFAEVAALKATTSRTRVDSAKTLLAKLAPALANASPRARQELVAMLVPQGSVMFDRGEIRIVVRIPEAGGASRAEPALAVASAAGPGCQSGRESPLEFQVVAYVARGILNLRPG